MTHELLAFRLFGDFVWPTDPLGNHVTGCIEIFYLPVDAAAAPILEITPALAACFRWTPKARWSTQSAHQPNLATKLDRLASLNDQQVAAKFADPKQVIAFRLDDDPAAPASAGSWPRPLRFVGGAVFEQYSIKNDEGEPTLGLQPTLQWPLARRFNRSGKGKPANQQPAFVLGDASDKYADPERRGVSFGFQLALYTPGTQATFDSTGSAGSKYPSYAFAFRVRYWPLLLNHPTDHDQPVPVGWFASGGADDYQAEDPVSLETIKISRKWLGSFGFSRTDGGSDNLHVPRKGILDRYWPSDGPTFVNNVLSKFGVIDPRLGNRVQVRGAFHVIGSPGSDPVEDPDHGELRNAIRFRSVGARSVILYRSSMQLVDGADNLGGDIGIKDGSFDLSDPWFTGERLSTNSDIVLIDIELEYYIPDPWRVVADPQALKPTMRLYLGIGASIDDEPGNDRLGTDSLPRPASSVRKRLASAVGGLRLSRLALRDLEPLHANSLLPEIEIAQASNYRLALCAPLEPTFGTKTISPGVIVDHLDWVPADDSRPGLWPQFKLTGWPDKPKLPEPGLSPLGPLIGETGTLKATLRVPSFAYRDKATDTGFPATLVFDENWQSCDYESSFRIVPVPGSLDAVTGRLGGIEFTTTQGGLPRDDQDSGTEYSYWRFSVAPSIGILRDGGQSFYPGVDAEVRLRLTIARLASLGGDLPRGYRDTAAVPLLIPEGSAALGSAAALILDATEKIGPQFDRRLTATIRDVGNGEGTGRQFVLIGEQPFSIKRVLSIPLQDRGSQDNVYVAEFDSDTGTWSFKLVTPTYHYVLPPQSVGESMDKPRRLEIHDPAGVDSARTFVRPYPDPPTNNTQIVAPGLVQRHAVEFRLTPSAELWVQPGDLERGYYVPEWETDRLFGSYDAYGLGVPLAGFRGEFIYGLPVSIDPSRETGAARGARVAEIGALMGRPPGPLPASSNDARRRLWDQYRSALARRPERLEFWTRDLSAARPFTPARFSDGVRFALRQTAVHSPPVDDIDATQDERDAAYGASVRLLPHGLRGGALWPLESANFARQLRLDPEARGGTIERIALAPGGGDADQRAEFLNGKVAIISETRNGYVQRHRVEIIGRIAVFWHRAKHVVVYERTTCPSEQFTPESGLGTRTRRPVLRKVSEYIELLQPARTFPDFATAKGESSGFLRAVRFNSRIINVDSAWSEDLGTFGWRIPLWNRHAATQRPHVYPRPDISFVTASEGDGDAPTTAQECLDPDNLWFFADAEAKTDDTDGWIARLNIDAANLPAPAADQQSNIDPPVNTGTRQPSAARVPRGFRRFTWRLAPGAQRTILNAERGTEPLFAGLETLTFMRATSGAPAPDSLDAKRAATLSAAMSDQQNRLPDALTAITPAAQAFVGAADGALATTGQALVDAYHSWRAKLDTYAGNTAAGTPGTLGGLLGHAAGLPDRCTQMVDDFAGSLQRRKLLVLDKVRTWKAEEILGDYATQIGDPAIVFKKLVTQLMKELRPVLGEVSGDVGKLKNEAQRARSIVDDLGTDLLSLIEGARRKVADLRQTYDDDKPWSPHRIDEFQHRISTIREGSAGDIRRSIGELQSRLATEVDAIGQLLTNGINEKLIQIEQGENSILLTIGKVEGSAGAFLATVRERIKIVRLTLGEMATRIDAAIVGIADPADPKRVALETLREYVDTLTASVTTADTTLAAAQLQLQTADSALTGAVEAAAKVLKDLGGAIDDFVAQATLEIAKLDAQTGGQIQTWLLDQLKVLDPIPADLGAIVSDFGAGPDRLVQRVQAQIDLASSKVRPFVDPLLAAVDDGFVTAGGLLNDVAKLTDADAIADLLESYVVGPAVSDVLAGLAITDAVGLVYERLATFDTLVANRFDTLETAASAKLAELQKAASDACAKLGAGLESAVDALRQRLSDAAGNLKDYIDAIEAQLAEISKLRKLATDFLDVAEQTRREMSAAAGAANAYVDRVFEAAGNVTSGGIASVPNNVLRLWAAAASAPALPNLNYQRERLAYYYNELNKIIDTTPAEAWFGRLGDELKAIGLSIPFSKIGDAIVPEGLEKLDIGKVFRNFAGIDLSKLFPGYKLPSGSGDAIRLSHAFDQKLFRAWVQIDINLPLPERRSLFSVGPFSLDFVGSRLTGFVRLQASKDTDSVEQSGEANLITDIDAVVSGQSMVALQKVGIHYARNSGLKIDFDPKNLRLNPAFQFIQDTLGSLIPDEVGGIRVVKDKGIPVGIEHDFSMPPISLMYGTSGVSNIAIANHFSLIAYPDFVIANRFALSSAERPFIFSIFIIGGTGYISIDCEYRPFVAGLAVVVDAAAGGSASLGFAAGPINGQVMISLSIVLTYHKSLEAPGGGLNMSLTLLIAGGVDVAGIASVYLTVLLRMTYRDSGQIDGNGSVSVSLRISRFFTFHVRTETNQKLRGGGGSSSAQAAPLLLADHPLQNAGRKILGARG